VRSALAQTFEATEVIVVVDGPDEATVQALHHVNDARLQVKVLPRNVGAGGARNAGVEEARGRWVAFLDDDDEWFPGKLAVQLKTALRSQCQHPIVSCRFIARGDRGELVWPHRIPEPGEPLSEYLFCQKRGPFRGEGLVHPSTVLTTRDLVRLVPFGDMRRLQDVDWVLRAVAIDGAGVAFVPDPEPLAVWHLEKGRYRGPGRSGWGLSRSLAWIRANQHLVTPRAYASFVLMWLGARAARQGNRGTFVLLLREARRHGRPVLIDIVYYLMIWLVPWRARRRLEGLLRRHPHR
jgi:glycosyltransferase involved in cell wall biosynthesis